MSKVFKRAARIVLPVAASIAAPGIGTALGSTLSASTLAGIGGALGGAAGSAISGGSPITGAIGGAAFGAAPALAGATGATGAGLGALTGAVQGGALGLAGGGNAGDILTGAALGGAGGYIGAGGEVPGLGSLPQAQASGIGPVTQGSGVLGKVGQLTGLSASGTSGLGSLTNFSTGSSPLKLGSLLSAGGDIAGYLMGSGDLDEIQRQLAAQSAQAQAQYQPYAQAGTQALQNLQAPNLEALQADPGYQFQLQQGNQALERSLAALGLGQSGAALKAAQEYGQGLANTTYNDYFNRQAQLAEQGFGAAQGLGSLYTNLGNVQAAAELERINQRNRALSGLGGLFA